jgi:DNA-binding transcriptional ArsR family regulator
MTRLFHPSLQDVPLEGVLHALADPARLEIVRALDRDCRTKGEGQSCGCAAPEGLPRATISNHFMVLRNAGLIEGRKEGTRVIYKLRRREIDARFPGLLGAILNAPAAS